MNKQPIGIFDSGVGGLTVLAEMTRQLPSEDIIYFGDTARVPYGSRSKETVIRYTMESANFLVKQNVKALVIACNTATAFALDTLKKHYDMPIIGVIEPGSRAAVHYSKNQRIGIIGTEGTIRSRAYESYIRRKLPKATLISTPCPLFVPLVEEGWENTDFAYLAAKKYLADVKEHRVDSLVLGCTHYPALRYTIQRFMGEHVKLINPAYETAKKVKQVLDDERILHPDQEDNKIKYYVSDDPDKFKRVGMNLIKKEIDQVELISLDDCCDI